MQLSIDGEGHLSYVELTDEQVKYIRELSILPHSIVGREGFDWTMTLADAAQWAIEQSRQAWQGQQDGPGNGT